MSDTNMTTVRKRALLAFDHDCYSDTIQTGYKLAVATNHVKHGFSLIIQILLRRADACSPVPLSNLSVAALQDPDTFEDPFGDFEDFLINSLRTSIYPRRNLAHLKLFLEDHLDPMTTVCLGPPMEDCFDAIRKAFEGFESAWTKIHGAICPNKDMSLRSRTRDTTFIRRLSILRINGGLAPKEWWDLRRPVGSADLNLLENLQAEINRIGTDAVGALEGLEEGLKMTDTATQVLKNRLEQCRTALDMSKVDCFRDPERITATALDRVIDKLGHWERLDELHNLTLAMNWDLCERALDFLELWRKQSEKLESWRIRNEPEGSEVVTQ